jgi:hypothetical protein
MIIDHHQISLISSQFLIPNFTSLEFTSLSDHEHKTDLQY